MPTILTPQGWVKVAPAARKKTANSNPKAAFRGPLAYLACQPQTPTLNVGGNIKGKAPFPYDLSASPEKLKRQSQANVMANRTVSEPVMHGALHDEDEYDVEVIEPERVVVPPPPRSEVLPRSKPKSRSSRHHHDDDNRSVASSSSRSSTTSSTSSRSSLPSDRSYNRHRPVESRPRPPPAPSDDHYSSAPRYDHRFAPPPQIVHVPMPVPMPMPMPMPLPPSSGRSLSYSWYNATTPLNFN